VVVFGKPSESFSDVSPYNNSVSLIDILPLELLETKFMTSQTAAFVCRSRGPQSNAQILVMPVEVGD
jgi:hypothetical protein